MNLIFRFNDEITFIHKEINNRENNYEDGDKISIIKGKIRIIDSECESWCSNEDIAENTKSFE